MDHKYLFILSPPFSGSTVLWRLLQTSMQVSALPDEGQKLPELEAMMRAEPWNPEREFDWQRVGEVWHSYWDLDRPVLLEKSPPHLCRFRALDAAFQPAWYILLLRDPLATCEALERRNGWSWEQAAGRWLEWLRWHLECRQSLTHTQVVYYEDMVGDRRRCFAALANWLPELGDVDPDASVRAHSVDGVRERPLTDLNAPKLARLSEDARARVIAELRRAPELLAATRYADTYL